MDYFTKKKTNPKPFQVLYQGNSNISSTFRNVSFANTINKGAERLYISKHFKGEKEFLEVET